MKNRTDIKNFILQIENDFPVNDWKINDIHLWPVVRIKLFFYLINVIEGKSEKNSEENVKQSVFTENNKITNHFLLKVKNSIQFRLSRLKNSIQNKGKKINAFKNYLIWYLLLPSKEYLFLGADSHRVNYKGKRFNRYFDIIIEKNNIKSNSMYFEYDNNSDDNIYNKELIYRIQKPLQDYINYSRNEKINNFSFDGYDLFLKYLAKNEITKKFTINYSEQKLEQWFYVFWKKVKFFKKVLSKIKPKQVEILCYYWGLGDFAFTCAANQLGIETIEMQHGPQTDIHLCYGSWFSIPSSGYDILPRTYYCWDDYSKNTIQKWTSRCSLYKVETFGNPWVSYWKNKRNEYLFKDFILYSLQPDPITLEQLFPSAIIKLIKESEKEWFLRLHPRQISELKKIKSYLMIQGVFEMVNIDDATNDPLPLLLSNSHIHITHFSGSALEASFFGLKTVLINEIGRSSFPYLIQDGLATYINYLDDDFYIRIKEVIK